MKTKIATLIFGLSLAAAVLLPQTSTAQVLLSGGTYSQNFDTLATNGSPTWADNTTLPGWFAAKAGGTGSPAVSSYIVNAGVANTGGIYSYGLTNNQNRALGSLGSSTPKTQCFGVAFTNDTANAQNNFTISYTGEEWRSPSVASNEFLGFSYRVATSAAISDIDVTNDALWTAFSSLNFVIPETVNIANAMLDGTNPTNQVAIANVVLTGVTLQPGQALFLRWRDIDDSGSDAGLAIDNFSISFTATAPAAVPAYVITQPANQTVYLGDAASFSVFAGGDIPFTYQWYFTNSSGVTLLTNQTNATLNFSYITTNLAGGYFVSVTNTGGGTNSLVANLTVNVRTPIVTNIAYLRTLVNPTTFAPTDTTNLYTVQGIVTSHVNTTGSTNLQFYMQDGAAGMLVFISGGVSLLPAAGDRVQVTGPLGQFYGQLELNTSTINPAHSFTNISSGNSLPAPTVFNLANVTNYAYMKAIESSLVVISNVYLQGAGSAAGFVSASTVNLTNLNNVVFPLYVNAYVSDVVASSIPTFAASITAEMTQHATGTVYTNGYEIVMTQYADLVAGTPPVPPVLLNLQTSGGNLILSWGNPALYLQSSTNVAGPYVNIPGATSPFTNDTVTVPTLFFRLTSQGPPSS